MKYSFTSRAWPKRASRMKRAAACTVHDASTGAGDDPTRDPAAQRGPARADRREDECARRGGRDPRAIRGIQCGREDRSDRAGGMLVAARRRGHVREYPRAVDPGALPRSTTASGSSATMAIPTCGLPSADWMGRNLLQSRRGGIPPVRDVVLRKRVVDEGLRAYLADNVDAWELHSDGGWTKVKRRRGARAKSAQGALLARMRTTDDMAEARTWI